jgi:hypothetical protein
MVGKGMGVEVCVGCGISVGAGVAVSVGSGDEVGLGSTVAVSGAGAGTQAVRKTNTNDKRNRDCIPFISLMISYSGKGRPQPPALE